MTAISDFNMFILPFLRGCSGLAAEIAARFALIEFCEQSLWLQYEADPITIEAGIADYEIETPQDTRCVQPVSATIAGQEPPLAFKTQDELAAMYGDWRAQEGTPLYITQIDPGYLRLVPSPTDTVSLGLRLILALAPTVDAPEVDDGLYQRHAECISYGARARLKEMTGEPYSDPAGAIACREMFYAGVRRAQTERIRDFTRAQKRVQFQRFGK